MHIAQEKEHLRQSIKERLSHMNDRDREEEGRSISRRILETIEDGSVVCAYYPMKTEARLTFFLEKALEHSLKVYLPCFEENALVFRAYTGEGDLVKGALGTMEPPPSAEEVNTEDLQYVLVPGLAFDREGHRLGRGNGGYDKWIVKERKKNPQMVFWGIAFDCQIVNAVPFEPHDEKMDLVITSRETIDIIC